MTPETSDPNQCAPGLNFRPSRWRLQHESMATRMRSSSPLAIVLLRNAPRSFKFVSEARKMIVANPETRKA